MNEKSFRNYIDITPLISSSTAVFPGDKQFERNVSLSFSMGNNLELSSIHTTLHIGAHTDAPSHYHKDGESIEKRDLTRYMGDCQIIEVNIPKGKRIMPEDINTEIKAKRILFKTNSFPNPNNFNLDFNALSVELIYKLKSLGVVLIGLDTPSVDPADDKELLCHNAIFQADMAILEGVVLDQAPAGLYHLIALPLPIQGADASPVRAILLKD